MVTLLGCGDIDSGGGPAVESGGDRGGSFAGDSGGGGGGGGRPGEPDPIPAGQLTAGEWRDLDDWSRWTDLVDEGEFASFAAGWGIDTVGRIAVHVDSAAGAAANVPVTLLDGEGVAIWSARTDIHGNAELFPSAYESSEGPYAVAVAGQTLPVGDGPVVVNLDEVTPPRRALDLMFVIDTTGSMGDELRYIQAELDDVIDRSQANAAQSFDLRLSVNLYRDEGDEYVVRSNPFSGNPEDALRALTRESANGGGDWPEAVDRALDDAIFDHEWSEDATARLLFLVLDAPPHADSPQKMERLRTAIQAGAELGIRVIPVSGTGVDQNTETLLRSMAITTGGTYAFLTDHSGIGGDHLEPTVGDFDVEFLNDLLVRLIVESIDG
ncbi:MAG: vWA domain-containing protein [Myxococcota bacterium]